MKGQALAFEDISIAKQSHLERLYRAFPKTLDVVTQIISSKISDMRMEAWFIYPKNLISSEHPISSAKVISAFSIFLLRFGIRSTAITLNLTVTQSDGIARATAGSS